MIIYIDTLLLINYITAYLILLATKRLSQGQSNSIRLILSSLIASISSLVILVPLALFLQIIYKFTFAIIITGICFEFCSIEQLFKETLWYFLLNMCLAGVVILLELSKVSSVISNNFTAYFNVSPITIALSVTVMYFLIRILLTLFLPPGEITLVEIGFDLNKNNIKTNALYDTGFNVKDMFSDMPVVLLNYKNLKNYLPKDYKNMLDNFWLGKDVTVNDIKLRLLPYSTASGSGILPAVKCENLKIIKDKKEVNYKNALIAFTRENLADGQIDALVGKIAERVI